ncbi:unnamed protein product, partial [Urochloa humidicola]
PPPPPPPPMFEDKDERDGTSEDAGTDEVELLEEHS